MDVLLLLALAIGLIYCLYSAARWAFRIDSQTSRSGKKSKHRKHKKHNGIPDLHDLNTTINRAFEAFEKKRPKDE